MEGLAQYSDSDSDHEQHDNVKKPADAPGEGTRCPLGCYCIVMSCWDRRIPCCACRVLQEGCCRWYKPCCGVWASKHGQSEPSSSPRCRGTPVTGRDEQVPLFGFDCLLKLPIASLKPFSVHPGGLPGKFQHTLARSRMQTSFQCMSCSTLIVHAAALCRCHCNSNV